MDLKIEKSGIQTSGSWHSNLKIRFENSYFYLSNTPSGCGSQVLHGYYGNYETIKKMLKFILEKLNKCEFDFIKDKNTYHCKNDIGMIYTTLGNTYCNTFLPIFEELGFRKVSEYKNPRHNGDLQCLLVWENNY